MKHSADAFNVSCARKSAVRAAALIVPAVLLLAACAAATEQNLLKNPGFEESGSGPDSAPNWTTSSDSAGKALVTDKEAHGGRNEIALPAHTAVEQRLGTALAGAYLARCWVKSESEQAVTFLLQDPERPWTTYNCAEIKVPAGRWVQLESFCALNRNGSLTLALGGMSKEFRLYHGTGEQMKSPIVADDFELVRYQPKPINDSAPLAVWDAGQELTPVFDWSAKGRWLQVTNLAHTFAGTPVIQGRHLVGAGRKSDGGLIIYSVQDGGLKQRCVLVPSPVIPAPHYALVQGGGRTGIRVSSPAGAGSYIAWFTAQGLLQVEANQVAQFQLRDCRLRYGLLPSFAGTDICYAPSKMTAGDKFNLLSTQWLVGLVEGNDSMLVTVWETDAQQVSLGLSGEGEKRLIDSLSIATDKNGFSLSFVEHAGIWHQEALQEDWLGEYQPIEWKRPFPARWMDYFQVTTGEKPSFRDPGISYAFPVANAKTRMWGLWFEDWNHYPFFFDGPRTILHFEKTFIPQGEALFYFLEPAAADLFSPVEIVEQALGPEKAAGLLDFDANGLRKLNYSTPAQFMFDRPVCATTTRLSQIKQEEKATVGVDLATHLYEFIREIRGRVDQYTDFFTRLKGYLATQAKEHPEMRDYLAELESMVTGAQAHSAEICATPLASVQKKVDSMKVLLKEGKGDGFNCGDLDVRAPAGAQDDLCRRYNRLVLRLTQTAALKCGDSAEKASVAKHIWDQSRAVLRQPTRWEPRRTLYFFEP